MVQERKLQERSSSEEDKSLGVGSREEEVEITSLVAGKVGNFVRPKYSGQKICQVPGVNIFLYQSGQPKRSVHCSYLRLPTNPESVREGKGLLTTRLKVSEVTGRMTSI